MTKRILIPLLLLFVFTAEARTWTDTQGKTFEATVTWVNAKKNVKLKTAQGEIIVAPFSQFIAKDVQYLEQLLLEKLRGKLHPVPWNEMNTLFGLKVWQDESLWDDPTGAAAKRMKLKKESKTDFMENHRAYPLGRANVLQEKVYTTVLYGGGNEVESLSFVFQNQGDISAPDDPSQEFIEQMTEKIEASGMQVHDALVSVLGEPRRDTIGRGNMREKVWRWDWNGHAIMLIMQEGKYAIVRIVPTQRADRSGKVDKIKGTDLRKRMAACVERRDNGDVIIQNIPMIDQGPKGYCSPATWERYLRYVGIPANMYQLALVGNTKIGGGTSLRKMIEATKDLLSKNGRDLENIGTEIEIKTLAKHIDKGLPIMWSFSSTPLFQWAANENTARRKGKKINLKNKPTELSESGGHICLIIGYNKLTEEISISDSWGTNFSERWVPLNEMCEIETKSLSIIKW